MCQFTKHRTWLAYYSEQHSYKWYVVHSTFSIIHCQYLHTLEDNSYSACIIQTYIFTLYNIFNVLTATLVVSLIKNINMLCVLIRQTNRKISYSNERTNLHYVHAWKESNHNKCAALH